MRTLELLNIEIEKLEDMPIITKEANESLKNLREIREVLKMIF